MKNLKFKIFIFLISNIFFIIFPNVSFAQNVNLGIYPPIFQIDSTPPADIKSIINLQNLSDETTFVNINIKPFRAAPSKDGQVELLDDFSSFVDPLFINRVRILDDNKRVTSLTLSPKQKKTLTMEIKIPDNQPHGDYYFTVIFSTIANSSILSNSTLQSGGIATNVLLTVGPKGKTEALIQDFSTPFFVNSGPVPFNIEIYNKSDHFITPSGEIVIQNMFGQSIGKITLLPVNILSNSSRLIPDEKNQTNKAIWGEKFLIGPYNARLTLSLSDNGPQIQRTISFFAFPVTYLVAILILLLVTVFIILRVKTKL